VDDAREWLETDGLGGFAMGTVSGVRTRRYHGCLIAAAAPPAGRVALVPGLEVWVETPNGQEFLSTQRYAPDVVHPDGHRRLLRFEIEPWPTWHYELDSGGAVVAELCCERGSGEVALTWRLDGPARQLVVRPLLAARDYHGLQRENPGFRFTPTVVGGNVSWHPYPDRPAITLLSTGTYRHDPQWYRQFAYGAERDRGLDWIEDLASPGSFRFRIGAGADAALVLRAGAAPYGDAELVAARIRAAESARRRELGDPLERAADAYFVRRGGDWTIIAGYPWFTDWGRDTFIALRGLCLSTGRYEIARRVLLCWADTVSEGMLPNRFTDSGDVAEYNAVDASLWYVVVVGELLAAAEVPDKERSRLIAAVLAILDGYRRGTRYRIVVDDDGLCAAGVPGTQLTWMDAKVGDRVVTPRIGKPVEVQALWINALAVGERFDSKLGRLRELATRSFRARFPREDGALHDVVDVDHVHGATDSSFRPNQIFAVGGLPLALLNGKSARAVVDQVEQRLWTPRGLRSLDPSDAAYRGACVGGVSERDGAYHQGTVWTWLAGPFIEAWVRCRRSTAAARAEARRRFLEPLLAATADHGLGHLGEIADGDPPHTPRGTPFQAWSLAEALRARALLDEAA
jgi:predicted glycogen debranching enzyme